MTITKKTITITRGTETLAHHSTDSPLSSYGQPVWTVEVPEPGPGPAILRRGEDGPDEPLDVIDVIDGWLIARNAADCLVGIIWSEGPYYEALVIDRETGQPIPPNQEWKINRGECLIDGAIDIEGSLLGSMP